MRIGYGEDTHLLREGRALIIGGVEIPHPMGLLGHSDADVLVHAVMDAILGAAALGDIGTHFSDSDPQYKGISSIKLLTRVSEILSQNGYRIGNIDSTIIAQEPRLSSYIPQMRKNIADALQININAVSVKAVSTSYELLSNEDLEEIFNI